MHKNNREKEKDRMDRNQETGETCKNLLKKHKWLVACAAAVLLVGSAVYGWYYSQPRFHDLTVELGTENVNITAFMTQFADARNVGIVTDLSEVDLGGVGSVPLTFRSGNKVETVTLTIEDTTPPAVEFATVLQKEPDYVPNPDDFVVSCNDLSDVTVRFAEELSAALPYGDTAVTVVVEDACGNSVSQDCTLSIVWMKSEYLLEFGETLGKEDLIYAPERDGDKIRQEEIDLINESGIGEYTVKSLVDETVCLVKVADTTPPELVVKDVSVLIGGKVTVESFVESCADASGDVEMRLLAEPDVSALGTQTVTVEAKDAAGNVATATATLSIVLDKEPPVIRGLGTLVVEKGASPNYLAGVNAVDKKDGACEVTFDAAGVNVAAAGTYFATYTSTDKSGNVAKVKRTVVVSPDQADKDALIDSIAAKLSSNPEEIRDYVRNTIKYNANWGGADPVWYGFSNKLGNCLVHAVCLQALLSRKGYETQLIWVTDRSHYWLIIHLPEGWRHIDATPGTRHSKYSLMTDEQRYSILQGRDWDRSAWPACN